MVNSTGYAGIFGLKNNFIPAVFSFNNTSKVIDRIARPSQKFADRELSLNLNNDSKLLGETDFSFTRDEFSRVEAGTADQNGTSRDFNLSNRRYLSPDERKMLNSAIHLYNLNTVIPNRIFSLNENLNLEHSDSLSSVYNYSFADKDSSGQKVKDNKASVSLRHKLYESLVSSGGGFYFKSDAEIFDQESYGLSWDEDYTKRLGRIGRVSLGGGLSYSREKRDASGSTISIVDERKALSLDSLTFLNSSRIDASTVVVTNLAQTIIFSLNTDYQLTTVGERTQIQRLAGGSIAEGQEVLVDYRADSSPFFRFNTLSESLRFRMDFLDNLLGVFYRLNRERHPEISGQENALLQTLTNKVFGVDLHYQNLEVELESEDYDSNLSPYKRIRLREIATFNPGKNSALTFQSSQSTIRLVNTQDTQRFFDLIARYGLGLSRYSRFNAEAGFRWQRGSAVALDETSVGCGYELNFGKFLMKLAYDLKRQIFSGDRLVNHFFSAKVRRRF